MIVYILTTDYYVAPLAQKEWQYRDGIEGGLGGKEAMTFNEMKDQRNTSDPPKYLTKYMTPCP